MRKSITFNMTKMLVLITGLILFFIWFMVNAFSEKYYISREKASVLKTYDQVLEYLKDDDDTCELNDKLESLAIQTNMRMTIVKVDPITGLEETTYTNIGRGTQVLKDLLDTMYNMRQQFILQDDVNQNSPFTIWKSDEMNDDARDLLKNGYVLKEMGDKANGQSGLYLFGITDANYLIALIIPLEGIRTSVHISSQFIAWMGCLAILIGSFSMWVYAFRFTKPIKEMAHVANQMANLDFETKLTVTTEDEIGELGHSINTLSENLESTIADLKTANISLQKDIQKKEEIDQMRKEFLSHVSHELKTPIAIIQGYAEGLKDGIAEDPESMEFYCDVIMDEAQKMNSMVKKLLTLNQLEFGSIPLNITRFDLRQMIENKLNSSQILIDKTHCKLVFEEKEETFVWADEFMIEEVFMNYLTNAIHYVRENGTIRIWFEKRGNVLRTNVYNEGNPIPEEELSKLWIKFYKVDKARTREYGGNGIGLSIVSATMKAHNKDYGVRNEENGVTFYFDLDNHTI